MAGRMNTRWYALYVRRKRDRPENLSAAVVYRESEDVAAAILDFVREERVGVLVVGRPSRKGLKGRLSPGIVQRVLENADGIDVMVADIDSKGPG